MKRLASLIVLLISVSVSIAQPDPADLLELRSREDSLKAVSMKIIRGINPLDRVIADSVFTRQLVRALRVKHSFYFPFDSLFSISRIYAPDSSFRIFTWQMVVNEDKVRQHGAIQMRTYDGSLKLFPLIDRSDISKKTIDTVANHKGWIGAVYYRIIQKKSSNQNYYTLIGYDENNINTNRKIIEVMNFQNDEPVFGGRYFSFEEDTVFKSSLNRFVLEYKKGAGPKLNYDPEMDMIVVEHLVSESNEPAKKWTLVPDGDYEGFKWKNGKWVHIEKIFNYVTPLGKEPVPNPIRDNGGNIDDDKLNNTEKPKTTPAKPKKKGDG